MVTPKDQPIVLHMKSWRERNCWARRPWRSSDRSGWNAGTPGHCAAWYCQTPWGAVWGSVKLHQLQGGTLYIDRKTMLGYAIALLSVVLVLAVVIAASTGSLLAVAAAGGVVGALVCLGFASSKWAR